MSVAIAVLGLAATPAFRSHVPEPGYAEKKREHFAVEDDRPAWISQEALSLLSGIGIDPTRDIEDEGNYHWSWRARGRLSVSTYTCPAGSKVAISRTLVLVTAPQDSPCEGLQGAHATMLKLLPHGSAEPFPR